MRFSAVLFCMVSSILAYDQIVPSSFQKLYPNVSAEKIESLTALINNQKTTKKAKQALNAWIDENWPETEPQSTTSESITEEPMETEAPTTTTITTKKSMFPNIPGAHFAMDIMPNQPNLETKTTKRSYYSLYDTKPTATPINIKRVFRKFIGEEVVTKSYAERVQNAPQFNPDLFGEKMQPDNWEEVYWVRLRNETTVPDHDCIPSKEYAKSQGSAFLDHRHALKSLVRFIYHSTQQDNLLSKKEAVKMRKLFWEADLKAENKIMDTEPLFVSRITSETWSKPSHEIYFGIRRYINQFRSDESNAKKLNWSWQSDRGC